MREASLAPALAGRTRRESRGRYLESEFRSRTAWDYFQIESF